MSASPTSDPGKVKGRRSVALILTLILLAITSLMLVAFMTTAGLDRTATFGYGQSLKAEQFGLGALQLVVGQLQLEMAKDAVPDTGGGAYPLRPVYTNLSPANLLPQPVGTNAAMPLLVKTSSTNVPFGGSRLKGGLAASAVGSTEASQNGRSIPLSRWNQAYLGSFPSSSSAPCWVLVTRAGPTNGAGMGFGTTGATLNNAAADNQAEAIGRFSYAVYDVGGLIDITAAGHATSLGGASLQAIKGTLAGANLALVGVNADQLLAWRNASTGATSASYADYVTNTAATNGFLAVAPNDTTFLGRQDLINAAKKNVAGLTTGSLTNLTVFSRAEDAPNWSPLANASTMGGLNGAGSRYAYADNAFNLAAGTSGLTNFNRNIPSVRRPGVSGTTFAVPSYRDDGTPFPRTVAAGDPVVFSRFPLGRLAWLKPTGPDNAKMAKAIQDCFGLVWAQTLDPNANPKYNCWQYVGTGATELGTIASLDQVAQETNPRREPNFFELLQAGVLSGSLGVDGGMTDMNLANLYQNNSTYQILRLGAAIIDQASPAQTPTVIEYSQGGAPWQAVGIKNLPCVNSVQAVEGQSPDNASAFSCYLLFTLWNPNQGTPAAARPSVRLHVLGAVGLTVKVASTSVYGTTPITKNFWPGYVASLDSTLELSTAGASSGVNGFGSTATTTYLPSVGDVVSPLPAAAGPANANAGTATPAGTWVTLPSQVGLPQGPLPSGSVGLRLPDLVFENPPAGTPDGGVNVAVIFGSPSTAFNGKPFTACMEFKSGNSWIPYQYFTRINSASPWTAQGPYFQYTATASIKGGKVVTQALNVSSVAQTFMTLGNDPRSTRFGAWLLGGGARFAVPTGYYQTLLWSSLVSSSLYPQGYGGNSGFQFAPTNMVPASGGGGFYLPATLARNNTANVFGTGSSYVDLDAVRRIGDSGLAAAGSSGGAFNPFWRAADRPVVLNRPFYSVAELGYALRDDPWRSLDFWSANSADSALLDLFTVSDATTNGLVAGKIGLNGRNAQALAAVLADTTITDPAGDAGIPVATITTNNAMALAAQMTNFTSAPGGALLSRDQAATRFAPTAANGFATTDDQYIKVRREALARALTDVGQTRTWNLMIDLVAQTGRYPATAAKLSDFIVEGERRYWLHVAIDRVTGQVLDRRLEVVSP